MIHANKGFDRIIRALLSSSSDSGALKDVYYVIVGREHENNQEQGLMQKLQDEFNNFGDNRVIWIDKFISEDELQRFLAVSDLFAAPFDEITPTSGTLLEAMANGIPIVATQFRFAMEMLGNGRGLLIPFDDLTETETTLKSFFSQTDRAKQRELGEKGRNHVANWTWSQVSEFYWKACFTMEKETTPIEFPYAKDEEVITRYTEQDDDDDDDGVTTVIASWSGSNITFFDGSQVSIGDGRIIAAAYIDFDIQINVMYDSGSLTQVYFSIEKGDGFIIKTRSGILSIERHQIEDLLGGEEAANPINIEPSGAIRLDSHNVICRVKYVNETDSFDLQLQLKSTFAHPMGFLGSSVQKAFDLSYQPEKDQQQQQQQHMKPWILPSLTSVESPGQVWSVFGIRANGFDPQNEFILSRKVFQPYEEEK